MNAEGIMSTGIQGEIQLVTLSFSWSLIIVLLLLQMLLQNLHSTVRCAHSRLTYLSFSFYFSFYLLFPFPPFSF